MTSTRSVVDVVGLRWRASYFAESLFMVPSSEIDSTNLYYKVQIYEFCLGIEYVQQFGVYPGQTSVVQRIFAQGCSSHTDHEKDVNKGFIIKVSCPIY